MDSVGYWNDEQRERHKPYWIERVDDQRLVRYLEADTNLLRCFEDGLAYADRQWGAVRGVVFDLAAGVCWTSAIVSRWGLVEEVHAYDYSEHRICRIAPLVLAQMGAVDSKVHRHCESFYPLPAGSESADLVIFCQALYMTDSPADVLREVRRILRPKGVVMISCENIEASHPGVRGWLRRVASTVVHQPPRAWWQGITGQAADESGRHPYRDEDYRRFMTSAGFRLEVQQLSYPVMPGLSLPAVNYFGIAD